MNRFTRVAVTITSVLASLSACVSAPTGPTIAVMPREGKPFEVFQQEDQVCRQFAANAVKDTSDAALKEGVTSAALAAALGAAAGAEQRRPELHERRGQLRHRRYYFRHHAGPAEFRRRLPLLSQQKIGGAPRRPAGGFDSQWTTI